MARRSARSVWAASFQRSLNSLTRSTLKAGAKVISRSVAAQVKATKAANAAARKKVAKKTGTSPPPDKAGQAKTAGPGKAARPAQPKARAASGRSGQTPHTHPAFRREWTLGVAGARRYRLFTPSSLAPGERLPLLVMLHGCTQDAEAFALSTRMNRLAERERCIVLYPEQDRLANPQACWNWYETRNGRAQAEATMILAAVDQVCRLHRADPARVALAGLSAGAGMAALLATRHPSRFVAVAMHSGIAPGVANSTASALRAMSGLARKPPALLPGSSVGIKTSVTAGSNPHARAGKHADETADDGPGIAPRNHTSKMALPALLVIQGSADRVVAASNGEAAARRWADALGATATAPRELQRGQRHPVIVTDFKRKGRVAVSLCMVQGLGHAWSGGAAGLPYSDPQGPDASRMVWAFVAKQFARVAAAAAHRVSSIAA